MTLVNKLNYIHRTNVRWRCKWDNSKQIYTTVAESPMWNYKRARIYRWNDILFGSTFNEIVRQNGYEDLTQYNLFREKNFIKSSDKGFFSLMPFVLRSLERLVHLLDEEMYKFGAQKIMMPTIVGKHLWVKSGRWDLSGKDIFRVLDRHGTEFCLAPTHEEMITQIIASCNQLSCRQLPIYLYQISPKYRDELRTKFGLLRAREFIMKDLYTFDKDEETAKKTYQTVSAIYENLFRLLELPIVKSIPTEFSFVLLFVSSVLAVGSVGTIGGKYSHEFFLETSLGEDELYTCLDCLESFNAELLSESTSLHCLNCKSHRLSEKRQTLELGHSFLLSDRYSSKLGAFYLTENSNRHVALQMGCYGIGVSRLLAASVEYLSNKYQQGPIRTETPESEQISSILYNSVSNSIFLRWPRLIVPFKICLILPKRDSKEDHGKGTEFSLHMAKVIRERFNEDVLIDDRSNLTIGKRLLTAKTIGIPFIVIAGKNIIQTKPKFELFDMYDDGDPRTQQAIFLTQAELLNYLEVYLKRFI